jgi:hypothetical protein
MHKHPQIEQTYVIEGSFYDHHGIRQAGEFVWRRVGSFHETHSDEGAVILAVYISLGMDLKQDPNAVNEDFHDASPDNIRRIEEKANELANKMAAEPRKGDRARQTTEVCTCGLG